MTTRRAFLTALPGAAAALPMLSSAADGSPVQAANLHLARLPIGERTVFVDLAALPRQSTTVDEDTRTEWRPNGLTELWSTPEPGAEYVVIAQDGEILISRLEANYTIGHADPRRGFMAGKWEGHRASYPVRVLGQVIA